MLVGFMVLAVLLIIAGILWGPDLWDALGERKIKKLSAGDGKKELSRPSKQILIEYNRLPDEHRNFGDIEQLLRELDDKHSMDKSLLDQHFGGGYYYRMWTETLTHCTSQHRECKLAEYWELHQAIQRIEKTIDQKKRAELLSRHASTTEQVHELTAHLNTEAEVNEDYIEKFKELT